MKSFSRYFNIMSISLSLFSFSALAGGVGNGGVSVVCRDEAGKIKSAEVLDIYEGEVRYGRKYDDQLDIETHIGHVQSNMKRFPNFLNSFKQQINIVKKVMVFIPKGNRLTLTEDALPKFQKEGCQFEQLANYLYDFGPEVLVSLEIWDELSELNKAALYVHESVYAIFRSLGATDSQLSRRLTAQLLSTNADRSVIDAILTKMTGSQKLCGNIGTVEERISDCNEKKGNFPLVARTQNGREIFKDIMTGLIWSNRLPSSMSFEEAKSACKAGIKELAGISGLSWMLPSIEDFKGAISSGILDIMSHDRMTYWTSLPLSGKSDRAWVYSGYSSNFDTDDSIRSFTQSVRCVGVLGGDK